MRGLALNPNLLAAGATFVREATTAADLSAVVDRGSSSGDDSRRRTAARRSPSKSGRCRWRGSRPFSLNEPAGLCIGKVMLADGSEVLGVLGEPVCARGRRTSPPPADGGRTSPHRPHARPAYPRNAVTTRLAPRLLCNGASCRIACEKRALRGTTLSSRRYRLVHVTTDRGERSMTFPKPIAKTRLHARSRPSCCACHTPAWPRRRQLYAGSNVNVLVAWDFSDHCITPRGLNVEDDGLIGQPLLLPVLEASRLRQGAGGRYHAHHRRLEQLPFTAIRAAAVAVERDRSHPWL